MKSFAFPGNIEPDILAIAAGQVPYMRTKWFSDLVLQNESILLKLLECTDGRVIPFTASGTAALDSCVTSFVRSFKMPLAINGGTFGARWGELCRYYNVPHEEFHVPFGKSPDMASLAEHLRSGKYDVLLMQHHETSSGYLYDLDAVSALCQSNNVRLVVDAIGSFLADPFSIDRHAVDVTILSSHKGLNLPPGLSFVVLSNEVVKQDRFKRNGFYCDWEENLCNLQRGQTPFSPATHLFMQLNARLLRLRELGVSRVIEQTREKAAAFRQACSEFGWSLAAEAMSNCLTGVRFPFKARPLVDFLNNQHIYVMPSGPDNMIRVTHLGTLDCDEQTNLAKTIREWQIKEKL